MDEQYSHPTVDEFEPHTDNNPSKILLVHFDALSIDEYIAILTDTQSAAPIITSSNSPRDFFVKQQSMIQDRTSNDMKWDDIALNTHNNSPQISMSSKMII